MTVPAESAEGDRWFRAQGPAFAVALLVSVIVGGTVGYMVIEGWSAWDAFYMTVITVTTVGYKEVHDLSRAGQVFTVVLLLFGGVGAALYTFTLLATVVVEGGLPKRLQRRRHARMLETRSRTTSSSAATGASAASSPASSSGRRCRLSSSSATRSACRRRSRMGRWRWRPMRAGRTC